MSFSLRSTAALLTLVGLSVTIAFAQSQSTNDGKPGEGTVKVPAVVGKTAKDASAAVRSAGLVAKFRLGRVATAEADSLKVYAIEPKPGTELPLGTVVNLTIYAATFSADDDPSTVPNLIGQTAAQAKAKAIARGLTPKFQLGAAAPTQGRTLTVYAQTPQPSTPLAGKAEVTLTIHAQYGSGPTFSPTGLEGPELSRVSVSPFLNYSEQELIDPRSGLLLLTVTDLVLAAGPVNLDTRRSFQNFPQERGLLGSQWRLNWEKHVLLGNDVAAIAEESGLTIFERDSSGAEEFRCVAGDLLVSEDDRFVRTTPDGIREHFDGDGRLVERDELNGNRIFLKYDSEGRLSRVSGPYNSFLLFTTDENGQLTRIDSSDGATVQYASGGKTTTEEESGRGSVVNYGYDEFGMLASLEHPQTGRTMYTYDQWRRVVSRAWADGSREFYEYDDETSLQRHIDPAGAVTTTQWTPDRRKSETTDPLGSKTVIEYDVHGRPVEITGATGQVFRMHYDALGRIDGVENSALGTLQVDYHGEGRQPAAIIGPGDEQTSFEYDAQQNLMSIVGNHDFQPDSQFTYYPNGLSKTITTNTGERTTLEYDSRGRVKSITDAAGHSYHFECDRMGNLVRETDPLGNSTMRAYDSHGRLTSLIDPEGGTTRFEYTPAGLLSRQIDPVGAITHFEYDKRGRLVTQTDPGGRVTHLDYDADGRLKSVVNSAGHVTQIEHDARGNLLRLVNPLDGSLTASYDPLGRLIESTGPGGGTTRYEYSDAGDLVKRSDPDGTKTRFKYDDKRRISEIVGSNRQFRVEYTSRDNISRIVPSAGPSVSLEYDQLGNLTRIANGDDAVVDYAYDKLGRCTEARYATGRTVAYEYDAVGNLLSWRDSLGGGQAIKYDRNGREIEQSDSMGGKTHMNYDPAGNLIGVTDPLGNLTQRSYHASGELSEIVLPAGDRTQFEYDQVGQLSRVHHPGGGETNYGYDAAGNPIKTTDPLGNISQVAYDAAGRPVSSTDAKGQTTTYAYNAAGQLVQKRLVDGKVISYRYDQQGNTVEVDDGNFPVRFEYDARGNTTGVEYPAIKRTLSYEYDEEDRLVRFTDSEGQSFTYKYDAHSQLSAIQLAGGRSITFTSDAGGRQTSITYPNDVKGTWEYDGDGRAVKLAYTDAAGKQLAGWTRSYDAAGNCTKIVDSAGKATDYRYDANGQLIKEDVGEGGGITYAYLRGGDRGKRQAAGETVIYEYDKAGRLLKAGSEQFSYDENGNLVKRKGTDGTTQYNYDTENRLVKVTLPDKTEVSYGYAPTGERIWRRDADGLTHYVTDGVNVLAQLDETLKPKATYLHAGVIDLPVMMSRDGKTLCLHRDQLGSIRSLTDENGKLAASYQYDAFGQLTSREGAVASPFTYTARELDEATGLYYYRARWYDARLGRFLTKDPRTGYVENPVTLNRYVYALNNPVQFVDPLGTDPVAEASRTVNIFVKFAKTMGPVKGMRYLQKEVMNSFAMLFRAAESRNSVIGDPARIQRLQHELRGLSRELHRWAQANPGAAAHAAARPLLPVSPPAERPLKPVSTYSSSVGSERGKGPTVARAGASPGGAGSAGRGAGAVGELPPFTARASTSGARSSSVQLPARGASPRIAVFSPEVNPPPRSLGQRLGQAGRVIGKSTPWVIAAWGAKNVISAAPEHQGEAAGGFLGSLIPMLPTIVRGLPGGPAGVLASIGLSVAGSWIGGKVGGVVQHGWRRPGEPPPEAVAASREPQSEATGAENGPDPSEAERRWQAALRAEHQAAQEVAEHLVAVARAREALSQLAAAEREQARQAAIAEYNRRVAAYQAAQRQAALAAGIMQGMLRATSAHRGGGRHQQPRHGHHQQPSHSPARRPNLGYVN